MPNTMPETEPKGVRPEVYTKFGPPAKLDLGFSSVVVYECHNYAEGYNFWTWRFCSMQGKEFGSAEAAKADAAPKILAVLKAALEVVEKAVSHEGVRP